MWQRVVERDGAVKRAGDVRVQAAKVSHVCLDMKVATGGLACAALDRALADVCGGDVIAGGGQAQRLGADTASGVQYPSHRALIPCQEASNHLGLPFDGSVPVGKDQVVSSASSS